MYTHKGKTDVSKKIYDRELYYKETIQSLHVAHMICNGPRNPENGVGC